MFLASEGQKQTKEQASRYLPIIDMVEGVGSTTSSTFTTKISKSMKMFSKSFAVCNHYLCVAASISTLIPATVIDIINYSW